MVGLVKKMIFDEGSFSEVEFLVLRKELQLILSVKSKIIFKLETDPGELMKAGKFT